MHIDEPEVFTSPRPGPISSASDLLIPARDVLVAWLLSIIWACAVIANSSIAERHTMTMNSLIRLILRSFWGKKLSRVCAKVRKLSLFLVSEKVDKTRQRSCGMRVVHLEGGIWASICRAPRVSG